MTNEGKGINRVTWHLFNRFILWFFALFNWSFNIYLKNAFFHNLFLKILHLQLYFFLLWPILTGTKSQTVEIWRGEGTQIFQELIELRHGEVGGKEGRNKGFLVCQIRKKQTLEKIAEFCTMLKKKKKNSRCTTQDKWVIFITKKNIRQMEHPYPPSPPPERAAPLQVPGTDETKWKK